MFSWLEKRLGRRRGRRSTGLTLNHHSQPQQFSSLLRSTSLIQRSSYSPPRHFSGDHNIASSSTFQRSLSVRPPSPTQSESPLLPLTPSPLMSLPLTPSPALSLPVPSRRPPPQGEIFMQNLVVFWDMENCRLKKRFEPRLVYSKLFANLTSALAGRVKFQNLTVKAFGAADYLGFSNATQQALRDHSIEYTDTLEKESTDLWMIRSLYSWAELNGPHNPAAVIAISGDKHFQDPMIRIRSFGHITINCSHAGGRNQEWHTLLREHYLDFIVGWRNIRP